MHSRSITPIARLGLFVVALAGCAQAVLTPRLHAPDAAPPGPRQSDDTLKVHLRSGGLYMLTAWSVDSARRIVGTGRYYDAWRVASPEAARVELAMDSIALVETNSHDHTVTLGLAGIGTMAVMGTYLSVVCLADPKSCFGSCPTFYVEGRDSAIVQAEGFSSSVASVLEDRDVDALRPVGDSARSLTLHMRNEAWETHLVRSLHLIAAPRPRDGRVFASGDTMFYPATHVTTASTCSAPDGDCRAAFAAQDRVERLSRVDTTDLAAREIVELTFRGSPDRAGIVIGARNSLVTTFLFYQTLAYVGRNAGNVVATMERGGRDAAKSYFGMARELGHIEVMLQDSAGDWRTIGEIGEAGPIATDTKALPLPAGAWNRPELRVRLRMARGNWRVDWVALASLGTPVQPPRISPASLERNGARDAAALATLLDTTRHLVSLPGDDFRLGFALPDRADRLELFLDSRGYYYEWMRKEWLAEENALMAALLITNPAEGLRRLAPAYGRRESTMEQLFWASRFNRRTDHAGR